MTGVILKFVVLHYRGPQVVCKCVGRQRATANGAANIQPDRNTDKHHTHAAVCNRAACSEVTHNRQLPVTCSECVIVTLGGCVSHKRVIHGCVPPCVCWVQWHAHLLVQLPWPSITVLSQHQLGGLAAAHAGGHITANHAFMGNSISLTHWDDLYPDTGLYLAWRIVSQIEKASRGHLLQWCPSRAKHRHVRWSGGGKKKLMCEYF